MLLHYDAAGKRIREPVSPSKKEEKKWCQVNYFINFEFGKPEWRGHGKTLLQGNQLSQNILLPQKTGDGG